MRHGVSHRKLGRTHNQRKALIRSLARALILNGQIETTLPKAKTVRPVVEKLVTLGKKGTLHARRQIHAFFYGTDSETLQKELLGKWGPHFSARPGGYTRIVRTGFRQGDHAPMAVIQFVDPS